MLWHANKTSAQPARRHLPVCILLQSAGHHKQAAGTFFNSSVQSLHMAGVTSYTSRGAHTPVRKHG